MGALDNLADLLGPIVTYTIVFIGTIKLLGWIYYTSSFIKKFAFTWPLDIMERYSGKDTWCVITGASDGIGAETARKFAGLGFNCCLISRTTDKLKSVEAEIKKINPKVKTKLITANFFGKNSIEFYKDLVSQVKDLDISLVYINAGIMPSGHQINMPVEVMQHLLDVNVYHYTMLHKLFLPKLLERTKQGKRSWLCGTASVTWLGYARPFVHYTATKGYDGYLSTAVNYELKRMGKRADGADPNLIDLHCSTPMGVGTNLVKPPIKERVWIYFTHRPSSYVDALHKDMG
jgi:short-subunit dehydrogenase